MLKLTLLVSAIAASGSAVAATPSLFETLGPAKAITANTKTTGRELPVKLNPNALEQAIIENGLWIQLPDNKRIFARTVRHQFLGDGNLSWVGKVMLKKNERTVVITMGRDAVFGSLVSEDGSPLKLETRKGATYLIVPDPKFDAMNQPGLKHAPDYIQAQTLIPTKADMDRTRLALAKASAPVVDVFIGYTPGLVTRYGSQAAAVTRLNFLVSTTNQAFADSQVDATLRLVGTKLVNYSDTATNSAALSALGDKSGTGPLQVLRDARRTSGADMLTIVRPFLTPEHGNCGLATVNGSNLGAYTTAAASGANAAVSDDTDDNSGYFCQPTTFAHELGHNWGLVHDSSNSSTPGPFPYTYGWRKTLPEGSFYTLMAYGADGQNLAPYYSNPDIYLCSGQPCGDAGTANQARALRQILPIASAFNQPLDPLIDINGDGSADVVYQNDGSLTYMLYESGSARGSGQQTMGTGYTLRAAGDFNGDHRTDLVWTSSARIPQIWITQPDGSFQLTAKAYTSYDVVGAADMSGDGKGDILFIKPSENKLRYWVMNGVSTSSTKSFDITPGYTIVSARDFNGDGLADLMWTNAERKLEYWQNNGNNTFTITASPLQYDQNLSIVGSGDFNNDGKADLAFFDKGALLLSPTTVWLMDGGNRIGTQTVNGPVLSLLHDPIAVDRYSGATASVMWSSGLRDLWLSRNDGTGENFSTTSILAYPASSPGSYYRNYPAGWTLFSGAPIAP